MYVHRDDWVRSILSVSLPDFGDAELIGEFRKVRCTPFSFRGAPSEWIINDWSFGSAEMTCQDPSLADILER